MGLSVLRGKALLQYRCEVERERERKWTRRGPGCWCLGALTQTSQVPSARGQRGAAGH